MHDEYYIEYYDTKGRRGVTIYYLDKKEAESKKEDLKEHGYMDVKIITVRF